MTEAVQSPSPSPPPTPPPPKSNPTELNVEKKRKGKLTFKRRFYSRRSAGISQQQRSVPKVANSSTTTTTTTTTDDDDPIQVDPNRKSFIWPWLEGKLDKKPSTVSSGDGGSSSSPIPPAVDSGNVLAPVPISAVMPESNNSGVLVTETNTTVTELIALFDPFCNQWYYVSLQAYYAMFGHHYRRVEEEIIPEEDNRVEENVDVEVENIEEKEVQVSVPKVRTILIGQIEVPLPPADSEEEINGNPSTGMTSSSSSSNGQDGGVKELEADVEHGERRGQKKGKKKKKSKGKKN